MMGRKTAEELAKEMGADIEQGINWTWAKGFNNKKDGTEFISFLEDNGYEHRGIYMDYKDDKEGPCSIRFR